MTWTVPESVRESLTDLDIITGVSIIATNINSGTVVTITPKAIELMNGILSMVVDDFYVKLTEGTYNQWKLEMKASLNFRPEITIATCTIQSSNSSLDITYLGVNVIYINLNWDGYCDITPVGKNSTVHVIRPAVAHPGIPKSKISEYVGNEKNVNLHKQLI